MIAAASVVLVLSASAAASTSSLYAFTGFENQPSDAFTKTSLYRINPHTGAVSFVVNYDRGVTEKPHGYSCLSGQAAHMAVSADGVIFGMPGSATDSPMLVHAPVTNVSFCDGGQENMWGITTLPGTDTFAAFYSNYDSWLGTFSFGMGILSMSADQRGPAATFEQKLGWDESDKDGRDYVACAVMGGPDQQFVAADSVHNRLYVVCDKLMVVVDTGDVTVEPTWHVIARRNITAVGVDHVLGFSAAAGAVVGTASFGNGTIGVGFLDTATGDWEGRPTEVALKNHGPAFAYDAASDAVFVYDAPKPGECTGSSARSSTRRGGDCGGGGGESSIVTVDLRKGTVVRTAVSDAIAITDLVFVP